MYRIILIFALLTSLVSGGPYSRTLGRIIGGEEVSVDQVPYLISVRVLGAHRCGGSLVNSDSVLTAAHCVEEVHVEFLKCVAGTDSRTTGGVSRRADKVIIHGNYKSADFQNDIAIIKLKEHFEYTGVIQPVRLASSAGAFRRGTKASIAGWGTRSEDDHFLPVKMYSVDVYAVDFDECVNSYAGVNTVREGMICTSSPIRGRDSCEGDAGSPVVVGGTQVGVVSWGQGCAREEYPRVHVEVAHYRSWIDDQLNE
ncbi:trypsin delta-like [Hermetia illucens]|uniref:trypsin delta-like n=1 Tax=Hermetia illucens TaxID=343691 RepID=UPI0018CBFB90|nr:trypsin delta-like [Hermetia illucens]